MSDDDNVKQLADALKFAQLVDRVLPVDEEMDRRASAALNRATAGYTPRKLKRRAP